MSRSNGSSLRSICTGHAFEPWLSEQLRIEACTNHDILFKQLCSGSLEDHWVERAVSIPPGFLPIHRRISQTIRLSRYRNKSRLAKKFINPLRHLIGSIAVHFQSAVILYTKARRIALPLEIVTSGVVCILLALQQPLLSHHCKPRSGSSR